MAIVKEATSLIFLMDGDPVVGMLENWVKAREAAHYSSIDVSDGVWVVEMEFGPRFVKCTPTIVGQLEHDNYMFTTYRLGAQEATMKIDLRA